MTSLVLFRCHAHAVVCQSRIALLQALNPGCRIHVLFGGSSEAARQMEALVGGSVAGWYVAGTPPCWNWRHGDLVVRQWFRKRGHAIPFDRAHLVEWDLLLLEALDVLYQHVPIDAIAVTARFPLRDVAHDWGWMTNDTDRRQWSALLSSVVREFGYRGRPYASLGPGTCYSRGFLERYSAIDIPELTNDEQRVPLYAQCFGITVADTNFRRTWDDPEELRRFNCHNSEVTPEVVHSALSRPGGRRAFHPFRRLWPLPVAPDTESWPTLAEASTRR